MRPRISSRSGRGPVRWKCICSIPRRIDTIPRVETVRQRGSILQQTAMLPVLLKSTCIALACCALAVPLGFGQPQRITAREVVERIKQKTALPWRADTVDKIKDGDPEAPVTGIATTMFATLDVLERAAASGKNLIIAHEPVFYNHLDTTAELESRHDPVLAAKRDFIAKHHLVVFRFHDYWHARRPDGIETGMTHALGWETFQDASGHLFTLPETTLERLASSIQRSLGAHTIRVVGDPRMKLTRVALMPGASPSTNQMRALERDDVDVLVIGETREWETVEYTRDAASEGKDKALIVIGHLLSEQAGMEECARWLKGFVSEVPIEFIPASEPFWSPK
jgi:putative NIF3 family GTP cyclohydrolase 1 type 2